MKQPRIIVADDHAIFAEGLKALAAGANPMQLKRGIDKAVEVALESVKGLSGYITELHERATDVADVWLNVFRTGEFSISFSFHYFPNSFHMHNT